MGDFVDDGEMLFVAFLRPLWLELLRLTSGGLFGTELSLMLTPWS